MNPGNDILATSQQGLRGTDSNSLLRLYDLATDLLQRSASQLELKRDRVTVRITHTRDR